MPTLEIHFNHRVQNVDAEVFYNPAIPDTLLVTPHSDDTDLHDSFLITRANNKWTTTAQSLRRFPATLQNIFNCLNELFLTNPNNTFLLKG